MWQNSYMPKQACKRRAKGRADFRDTDRTNSKDKEMGKLLLQSRESDSKARMMGRYNLEAPTKGKPKYEVRESTF